MDRIRSLLSWIFPQQLENTPSSVNGSIAVVRNFGKISIYVGHYQQSGPWVEKIWREVLGQLVLPPGVASPASVLVLGLGTGSILKPVYHLWPDADVVGVELDSVITDIGRRYFNLDSYPNLTVINDDAFCFLKNSGRKYDLILVDLYLGSHLPNMFEQEAFYKLLAQNMTKYSIVVFNCLTARNLNFELKKFLDKLKKYLTIRTTVRIDFNTLIVCSRKK